MSGSTTPKTVLITGCTPGGIGAALALEFHARGLHVIATARNTEVLEGYKQLGERITTLQLDVTDAQSIARCKADVDALTGGKLDILVNNAGRSHVHPATDIDLDDARQTFETNVFGIMAMVQTFVPLLINTKGLIINIASLSAVTPYVFAAVYCASKAAVVGYSRTLRQELRPFGVRVMISMTGTTRSNTASHGHRSLPENSLYARVPELFQKRLVWSQNNETVKTEVFAKKLVSEALKPEWPIFFRTWFGRKDWVWAGGMAFKIWLVHSFGEWLLDLLSYRRFGLHKLEAMVKRDERRLKEN